MTEAVLDSLTREHRKALKRCSRWSLDGWVENIRETSREGQPGEVGALVFVYRKILPFVPEPRVWADLDVLGDGVKAHGTLLRVSTPEGAARAVMHWWGRTLNVRRYLDSKHWKSWLDYVECGFMSGPKGEVVWPDGTVWATDRTREIDESEPDGFTFGETQGALFNDT